ncbi:hypothetical protein ACFWVF_38700 [Streptomyces sp. NPDC058659]|uniref:hypothetical protein n=1 Tax=Streptomyces sp. NPDC058659 TaxID=3346581 RepID=UPI00364A17AE
MTITQTANAALRDILAGEKVTIVDITTTPMAFHDSPAAYTVQVTARDFGVPVAWTAGFGEIGAVSNLAYPIAPGAPGFRPALSDLVTPLVREYQQHSQAAKLADYAQDAPGDVYEARDAIRRIGSC